MNAPVPSRFLATESRGEVSSLLLRPENARLLFVLGHGAGAGMHHSFLEDVSRRFFDRGVATFRYQFPYMEAGKKRPDPGPILLKTVRSAVAAARHAAPDLPVIAGGKSMGGRMTSQAAAKEPLPGVLGLAFLGFPLHAPRRDGVERAAHLKDVTVPLLFVQGTRDTLANLELMRGVCDDLPRATLHVVEGGDHSFHVLKRSGRTGEEARQELVDAVCRWADDEAQGER